MIDAKARSAAWSAHTPGTLGTDSDFEATRRLALDAGYGFGLSGGRGPLTPHAGIAFGE